MLGPELAGQTPHWTPGIEWPHSGYLQTESILLKLTVALYT